MDAEKSNSSRLCEETIKNYYNTYWSMRAQQHLIDENESFHHGFFEKGIKTPQKANQNMNKLIGDLLDLREKDTKKILDAGCGIGGTSIYLAKNYPCSCFCGISISPTEIELGNKIVKKQHLSNAKFCEGSYLDTEFPDGSFDDAFALESINHSLDKRHFIKEMSRVIKPGGKLVVVDWFRTDIPLSTFMQKIYTAWCSGQANISLESRDNFIRYLHDEGFDNIQVRDLYQNVKRSLFFTFIKWFPIFFLKLCLKIITMKKEKTSKDMKYLLALSALDVLIGEGKIIECCAITSVKK